MTKQKVYYISTLDEIEYPECAYLNTLTGLEKLAEDILDLLDMEAIAIVYYDEDKETAKRDIFERILNEEIDEVNEMIENLRLYIHGVEIIG